MAGNQEVYEQAMQAGDSAAWDQQWSEAITAYMQALREFPTEINTYNSLGYALFQAGRLEDALRVYLQAHKLGPNDPLPVEKSADVLERMGRVNDAAKQYVVVAEIYLGQHDLEKAIDNWERATRITPGMVAIHKKLAMAYERTGQRAQAVNEYLHLAFNFQNAGKPDVAMQALQRALRLDSKESRVLNAITAVRAGKQIAAELLETPEPRKAAKSSAEVNDFDPKIADADARGPIGEAVTQALELLAMEVFESGNMGMAEAQAMQAIEFHRADIRDEAISAYRRAEGEGLRTPALLLNLGVLLMEAEQWEAAIPYLENVFTDSMLGVGAKHALSLVYVHQRRWGESSKMLIRTLRDVDLSLSLDEDEIADLNAIYQRLIAMVEQTDDQTLENLSKRLAEMLTGADWKRRVAQTRSRLEEIVTKDAAHVLEDIAQGEVVIDAMTRIDRFISSKRYIIAMDETYHVIEREPDYLAAHLRIAQILMEMAQVEQAIDKYNMIARTYLLRGDQHKAADILNEAIKVAPADINIRNNLIDLLEQQKRYDEVVEQYMDLGESYISLVDWSNARASFDQALKLAQRQNMGEELILKIMHRLGDVDYERLDLRSAQRSYQRILESAPSDTRALRKLVNLHYRLNNQVQGLKELDKLLKLYVEQKRTDLVLEVLEEQARSYPGDMGIHARLASVYQQMKQVDKAVDQYEQLRQLQYEAGMYDEARQTIKRIISLDQSRAAYYQQLLQQMGG